MNVVLQSSSSVTGCDGSGSCYFFAFIGVASAIVFANMGAAYGTAKSGVGISSMGVMNPGLVMRNMIPVVMAGVLGIYGLIISVILTGNSSVLYCTSCMISLAYTHVLLIVYSNRQFDLH